MRPLAEFRTQQSGLKMKRLCGADMEAAQRILTPAGDTIRALMLGRQLVRPMRPLREAITRQYGPATK
jgi:hypothetical protein